MVPLVQIGQVDLSRVVDVAAHPDLHVLRGAHEDEGRVVGVRVQHPNRDRYVVVGTSEIG